jgi:hypothetical protein
MLLKLSLPRAGELGDPFFAGQTGSWYLLYAKA